MNKFYELIKSIKLLRNYCLLTPPSQPPLSSSTSLPSSPQSKKDGTQYFVPRLNLIRTFFVWNKSSNCKMTVGRRDILFADPRETERLIGRVLAGMNIWRKKLHHTSEPQSIKVPSIGISFVIFLSFEIRSIPYVIRLHAFIFSKVCVCVLYNTRFVHWPQIHGLV